MTWAAIIPFLIVLPVFVFSKMVCTMMIQELLSKSKCLTSLFTNWKQSKLKTFAASENTDSFDPKVTSTDGENVCNEVCQKQQNPLKDWLEKNGYSEMFSSRFSDCSSAAIDFDASSDYFKVHLYPDPWGFKTGNDCINFIEKMFLYSSAMLILLVPSTIFFTLQTYRSFLKPYIQLRKHQERNHKLEIGEEFGCWWQT